MNLLEEQIELEKNMTNTAQNRYENIFKKSVNENHAGTTKSANLIISRVVKDYSQAIRHYIETIDGGNASRHTVAYGCIKKLSADKIAFLSLRAIVNLLYANPKIQTVVMAISEALENEISFTQYKQKNSSYYRQIIDDMNKKNASTNWKYTVLTHQFAQKENFHIPRWTFRQKQHVGLVLIELLAPYKIIANKYEVKYGKRLKHIVPTQEFLKAMEDLNTRLAVFDPIFLPMVVEPKDWCGVYEGGYISPYIKRCKFIKHTDRGYLSKLENENPANCYNAVNLIQKTAWKINTQVLDVVKQMWEKDLGLAALPKREDKEVPPYPYPNLEKEELNEEQKEDVKSWKHVASNCYRENLKTRSLRFATAQILNIANKFSKNKVIYFPHQLDFRGRVYPIPVLLQPQGSDLAKGLLTFANGEKLSTEGLKWLKIHAANTFGNDKISYDERVNWADGNMELIKSYAQYPLENIEWTKVDKPFQFLAACIELNNYYSDPDNFISTLPVSVDGTNNGLQHYSALLRDEITGKEVNLINCAKPADIYQKVAQTLASKLQHSNNDALAQLWLELGINRKLTKRAVMTLPYGATMRSRQEYIKEYLLDNYSIDYLREHFSKVFPRPSSAIYSACNWLEGYLWSAIKDCLCSTITCMQYLKEVARIVSKENKPLEWYTPLGLLVNQTNFSNSLTEIRTEVGGKLTTLRMRDNSQKIDVIKQTNSVCANFIHSMDAACLMLFVLRCDEAGINSFSLVHDSYGTLANHIPLALNIIRSSFVEIYSSYNILEKFVEDVTSDLTDDKKGTLPPAPQMGNLDINEVLKSDYFFN